MEVYADDAHDDEARAEYPKNRLHPRAVWYNQLARNRYTAYMEVRLRDASYATPRQPYCAPLTRWFDEDRFL